MATLCPTIKRLASVQAGSADSDRPALARLLEAIRQGSVAVVVVSGLDRLAREDPAQSALLSRGVQGHGSQHYNHWGHS